MSIEKVRDYFRPLGREGDILEFPVSSSTVALAAQAVGVIPARIAKTLSLLVEADSGFRRGGGSPGAISRIGTPWIGTAGHTGWKRTAGNASRA